MCELSQLSKPTYDKYQQDMSLVLLASVEAKCSLASASSSQYTSNMQSKVKQLILHCVRKGLSNDCMAEVVLNWLSKVVISCSMLKKILLLGDTSLIIPLERKLMDSTEPDTI